MRFANVMQKLAVAALLVIPAVQSKAQLNPLYYLAQPGSVFTNQEFGTSPSMTVFNGDLYIAYQANDGSHTTWITVSTNGGITFNTPTHYTNILTQSASTATIISWNNELWLAYTAENGDVYLMSSSNGVNFSSPVLLYYGGGSGGTVIANSSPTLAVFNNTLWISVVVNGSGTTTYLETLTTTNGTTFTTASYCGDQAPDGAEPQTGAAVGVAVFSNKLWYAYQAQGDWNHELVVCSTNGENGGQAYYEPGLQVGSGVSAVSYQGDLILAYKAYSGDNDLTIASAPDGATYTTNAYSGITINGNQELNPSAAVLGNVFYLAYTQNNSGHHMYVTNNE